MISCRRWLLACTLGHAVSSACAVSYIVPCCGAAPQHVSAAGAAGEPTTTKKRPQKFPLRGGHADFDPYEPEAYHTYDPAETHNEGFSDQTTHVDPPPCDPTTTLLSERKAELIHQLLEAVRCSPPLPPRALPCSQRGVVRLCAYMRACVHTYVRTCVRICVRSRVRACGRAWTSQRASKQERERERERESNRAREQKKRHRQTDRQKDRQTDTQTERQKDRQTDRQTDW